MREQPDPVLAELLHSTRVERGMTQEDLSYRAGITISGLSRIERGLSSPSWTTLVRITRALDITLSALAHGWENAQDSRRR
jgi:transcriptional regulator with XRE-family HTH domain